MQRGELLEKMQQGRQQLEVTLARVDEQEMDQPVLPGGWSPKDLLAHLGSWEARARRLYQILSSGSEPDDLVSGESEVDALNARFLEEGRQQSLPEVRQQEQEAYRALLAVVESAPDEDLFDVRRFPWTRGRPLADWIEGNAHGHYDEHLPALQAWLSAEGR